MDRGGSSFQNFKMVWINGGSLQTRPIDKFTEMSIFQKLSKYGTIVSSRVKQRRRDSTKLGPEMPYSILVCHLKKQIEIIFFNLTI